jgi:hypothetical protein
MRKIEYISPTSLGVFYKNREEFYLNYLCDAKPPRFPQTAPMSVGSAFDAYVKSYLVEHIFGKGVKPEFEFQTIFEQQVEVQNRDQALVAGKHCFEVYQKFGAIADLLIELEQADGTPRFEFTVKGLVTHKEIIEGIPFLGKPDCFFKTKQGKGMILDWKVNGYYSKGNTSPKKGYVICRTQSGRKEHKDAFIQTVNGIRINVNHKLEDIDDSWATQVSIYSWLLGEQVCGDFVVGIDQLACANDGMPVPTIRVASFRSIVSCGFQESIFRACHKMLNIITSGHIFDELSREDSDAKCANLDSLGRLSVSGDAKDQFMASMARAR